MSEHFKEVVCCRICNSTDLTEVIHIEEQHLSPTFVTTNEGNKLSDIKISQTLTLCDKSKNPEGCGLLQLKETVKPDLLYKQYFYRSAVSDTMRKDLKDVVDDVIARVELNENDLVVDPFAGTGIVPYVASEMNRKFLGIEIDKAQYEYSKLWQGNLV